MAGPDLQLRWLPYFTMAWIDLIFDEKIYAQRLINVGLHLATGYVLYSLVLQVSQRVTPNRRNERAAIAAAFLFLMHPLAVYAVGYLAQRTILMATLFGLLTLNTYFDGLMTRKKGYFLFSALFYFLSAFSKEHAVLIPLAAIALTPLADPIGKLKWRALVLPLCLYGAIAALVIFKRQTTIGQAYEPFAGQLILLDELKLSPAVLWLLSALTQAALYFKYFGLALVPNPDWMSIDMPVPFAESPWQPKYMVGVIVLIPYTAVSIFFLMSGGQRGMLGYALLAPLLLFIVEFSTVRIQEPFVLYRAYLWMPLFFLAIPALTPALSDRLFWTITCVAVVACAMASTNRLQSFSNGFVLWDDAVKKLPGEPSPGAARPYLARCQEYLQRGNLDAAVADCTNALKLRPKYRFAYQSRAFAHMRQGKFALAIQDAQTIVELQPDDPHVHTILGAMYQGAGLSEKARASFEIACGRQSLPACIQLDLMQAKTSGKPKGD